MLYATGQTFPHKEEIKSLGGEWDNSSKRWFFRQPTDAIRNALKTMIGVMVVESETPNEPEHEPAKWLQQILDRVSDTDNPRPLTRVGSTAVYGDDDRFLNYFADQNPTAHFGFSSLRKLVEHVASIDEHKLPNNRNHGWDKTLAKWCGTPNMKAALKLASEGWSEGLEGVTHLDVPQASMPRRVAALAGGAPSIGRMMAGDPKHMIARPPQPGRKIVTFFVETFMSSGIDPENAIIRARLVAAMADALERQGYSCEIVAVLTTSAGRNTGHQATVTLKDAGERLNLLDVIFGLGHPSFFRRLMFACVGAADECRSTWSTQGSPTSAFTKHHPTRKNEFYVKQLSLEAQQELDTDNPMAMLPFIKPEGLDI